MKPIARLSWIVCMLLLTGIVWPDQASAAGEGKGSSLGREWRSLPTAQLDRLRGGFVTPSGLLVSFGIERAVYVNGALVATANFSVPDIARITVDQATHLASVQDTLLVQIGEGNTFVPNGAGGIVIQNTLDNQDIRALTTLNLSTSTLGLFQDMNATAALQSALLNAPGGP